MVTFLGIGIGIEGQFDVGLFVLDKELKEGGRGGLGLD